LRLHHDRRAGSLHQSVRRGGAVTGIDLERAVNSHPRVGVGNDSPVWMKPRRTVWGVTLDGKYQGSPRCRTMAGAYRKAAALIAELDRNAQ
jgi:hypothetical protein